ncbi:hypothetical protein [Candidatus Aalborgicola defluviihabitans]|uniref:hypothetical protein n=1 Tax=Candidatus Aalborgicola defluviihabitans TaxID=3386187 RepID=UPI00390922A4|nr:hypothetical protein [Burkholderiales bacterium]
MKLSLVREAGISGKSDDRRHIGGLMTVKTETTITKIINGNHYSAVRVVEGARDLRQYIVFRGHTEHDSGAYGPDEENIMASFAELLLWQIVVNGLPGQDPLEPNESPTSDS